MPNTIYLDYNATTPPAPEVLEVMIPCLRDLFGNPSSAHPRGRAAREALERARAEVAALLGAAPDEIVFTGGGTEANNLALIGAARALRSRGRHMVTTAVEHPAVLEVLRWLERTEGFTLTVLPVDGTGRVDPDAVEQALRPDTILVSVMHANNEVGTVQPVAEIAARCRQAGVLVHSDAAQSAGKIPVDVTALGVDLLTVAAHKLYGPKGVGALYVRRGTPLERTVFGAGQEDARRPGTENVPSLVGFSRACALAAAEMPRRPAHLRRTRELLASLLAAAVPDLRRHGPTDPAADASAILPNTLSVGFGGIRVSDLLAALPGVAASAGAACHGAGGKPSATLAAMGVPDHYALGTVRFSTGRPTTEAEVRAAAALIVAAARRIRG
jgi:cysteine desulfurase